MQDIRWILKANCFYKRVFVSQPHEGEISTHCCTLLRDGIVENYRGNAGNRSFYAALLTCYKALLSPVIRNTYVEKKLCINLTVVLIFL